MKNESRTKIGFGAYAVQDAAGYKSIKKHCLEAERLGYDSCWMNDHLFGTPTVGWKQQMGDAYTRLAALAEATSSIRLGALVTCQAFRNPALLAKMAATIDQISEGRFEFGIGAGWYQQEFESFGYEFPRPGVRLAQLEEVIQIYKLMMTEELPTFEGRYHRIKDCINNPGPTQKPYPPIWIGGKGEKKTLKLVAKYADKWNAAGTPDEFVQKMKVLKDYCEAIGRDYTAIEKTWWGFSYIDDDKKRLRERLELPARAARITVDEFIATRMAGTPDQFIAKTKEFVDIGVTHFIHCFGNADDLSGTQLFAQGVMKSFR